MRKDLRDSYDVMEVDVPPGRIRYPWYHRLDISMGKEFHFSTIHLEAYFSVRNAYARQNVLYYNPISLILHPNAGGPGINYRVEHSYKSLPIIPTIGLRIVL